MCNINNVTLNIYEVACTTSILQHTINTLYLTERLIQRIPTNLKFEKFFKQKLLENGFIGKTYIENQIYFPETGEHYTETVFNFKFNKLTEDNQYCRSILQKVSSELYNFKTFKHLIEIINFENVCLNEEHHFIQNFMTIQTEKKNFQNFAEKLPELFAYQINKTLNERYSIEQDYDVSINIVNTNNKPLKFNLAYQI